MPGILRHALDACIGALLAPSCSVCHRILDRTGAPVCDACWSSVLYLTAPLCGRCGDPLPDVHGMSAAPCLRCLEHPSVISRARALGPYEGALRGIVHSLKYRGRRSVAERLGALLRAHCADVFDGADALVPVPLHYRRRWTRGFNQADELAQALAPLPVWRVLHRRRATLPQARLPRPERARNVRGGFRLVYWQRARRRITRAKLVLVDDVSTTGATLEACARVLLDAGASEVRAITVARSLLHQTAATAPRIHGAGRPDRADVPGRV